MKRKTRNGRLGTESERRALGYDAAGHIDPRDADRLLALGGREQGVSNEAFAEVSADDFAAELGEAAIHSMTTGEDELRADLEAEVAEDLGGPFVETSGSIEFAGGTDESNIEEATREPFPTT